MECGSESAHCFHINAVPTVMLLERSQKFPTPFPLVVISGEIKGEGASVEHRTEGEIPAYRSDDEDFVERGPGVPTPDRPIRCCRSG